MAQVPQLTDCTTVGLFGPVSSGKTWLLRQWLQGMERSVTLDLAAQFMGPEFSDHIWHNPKRCGERIIENPYYYRIAYHHATLSLEYPWLYKIIWKSSGIRWFVVDEVHEVCHVNGMSKESENLCRYARHADLGFIGSSQRIAEVSKLMTSNCRMIVLFHTIEACDLDAIKDRWGNAVKQQVINLRPCIYDDGTKVCHQEPECLVWVRGRGTQIFSLGDKRKAVTSEQEPVTGGMEPLAICEHSPELPKQQETQYLEPRSGSPVNQLPEPS